VVVTWYPVTAGIGNASGLLLIEWEFVEDGVGIVVDLEICAGVVVVKDWCSGNAKYYRP
jgi:hypothetical protein